MVQKVGYTHTAWKHKRTQPSCFSIQRCYLPCINIILHVHLNQSLRGKELGTNASFSSVVPKLFTVPYPFRHSISSYVPPHFFSMFVTAVATPPPPHTYSAYSTCQCNFFDILHNIPESSGNVLKYKSEFIKIQKFNGELI